MKTIRVVAAVICDCFDENIKDFCDSKGIWRIKRRTCGSFPAEKLEAGETPQEALKREIMEELNTEIKVGDLIDTTTSDIRLSSLSPFHGLFSGLKLRLAIWRLKEAEAAKWLTKDQLDSVAWLPADVTLIDKIREYMK